MRKPVEIARIEDVLRNFNIELEEFEKFVKLAKNLSPDENVNVIQSACELFRCEVDSFSKKNRKIFEDVFHEFDYFFMQSEFSSAELENKCLMKPEMILAALFNDKNKVNEKKKKKISRLKDLLFLLSKFDEAIYHKNSTPRILEENENYLFEFEKVFIFCEEFTKLKKYYEKLFFEILNHDLSDDLIRKFNLFSIVFDARDLVTPSQTMTYDYVQKNRELFKNENLKSLEKYVSIRKFPEVYKCKNFYRDEEKAKEFITKYPLFYEKMKEFLPSILYSQTKFVWSDSKTILEEEKIFDDENIDIDDFDEPDCCDEIEKNNNLKTFSNFYHESFEKVGETIIDGKKFNKIQKVCYVDVPISQQKLCHEAEIMKKLCANSKISGVIFEDKTDEFLIIKRISDRISFGWNRGES